MASDDVPRDVGAGVARGTRDSHPAESQFRRTGVAITTATLIDRSRRLELTGIDFAAFARVPLDEASLRCLRYMHDVEGHTMCYLRDVLATRAHKDPAITAFLASWAYEEHWHGEAIARVLEAHGEPSGWDRLSALRKRLPRGDGARPLLFSFASTLSQHLVAVHMAWGAVNERSTQAAYGRLSSRAGHPVLSELLQRIMKQEGRHIDFYASEARRRLGFHAQARALTRFALRRFWAPVGAGVMPPGELQFMIGHLFGDDEGLAVARRIDRQIDRLPGLEGLHLLERAASA